MVLGVRRAAWPGQNGSGTLARQSCYCPPRIWDFTPRYCSGIAPVAQNPRSIGIVCWYPEIFLTVQGRRRFLSRSGVTDVGNVCDNDGSNGFGRCRNFPGPCVGRNSGFDLSGSVDRFFREGSSTHRRSLTREGCNRQPALRLAPYTRQDVAQRSTFALRSWRTDHKN